MPVLLYWSENWAFKDSKKELLTVSEGKILRTDRFANVVSRGSTFPTGEQPQKTFEVWKTTIDQGESNFRFYTKISQNHHIKPKFLPTKFS